LDIYAYFFNSWIINTFVFSKNDFEFCIFQRNLKAPAQ